MKILCPEDTSSTSLFPALSLASHSSTNKTSMENPRSEWSRLPTLRPCRNSSVHLITHTEQKKFVQSKRFSPDRLLGLSLCERVGDIQGNWLTNHLITMATCLTTWLNQWHHGIVPSSWIKDRQSITMVTMVKSDLILTMSIAVPYVRPVFNFSGATDTLKHRASIAFDSEHSFWVSFTDPLL